LSCYDELFAVLVSGWSHVFLLASELNGDTGLFDACESLLVNELSEASFEPEHFLAGAAKEELNGVKDVAFA
jgi:hypothetical protein